MLWNNRIINNERGLTVVEVVVSAGIAVIAGAAMITIMSELFQKINQVKSGLEFDQETLAIEYHTRRTFRNAVNTVYRNTSINNYALTATSAGVVRPFYSVALPANGITTTTLAVFFRDNANIVGTSGMTNLFATAVYFKQPSQVDPGILYFDMGNSGTGTLSPDTNDIIFTNLTQIEIVDFEPEPISDDKNIASFKVNLTLRKHFVVNQTALNYCPQQLIDIGNCPRPDNMYRDFTHTIAVRLRNNNDESEVLNTFNLLGRVYFYR